MALPYAMGDVPDGALCGIENAPKSDGCPCFVFTEALWEGKIRFVCFASIFPDAQHAVRGPEHCGGPAGERGAIVITTHMLYVVLFPHQSPPSSCVTETYQDVRLVEVISPSPRFEVILEDLPESIASLHSIPLGRLQGSAYRLVLNTGAEVVFCVDREEHHEAGPHEPQCPFVEPPHEPDSVLAGCSALPAAPEVVFSCVGHGGKMTEVDESRMLSVLEHLLGVECEREAELTITGPTDSAPCWPQSAFKQRLMWADLDVEETLHGMEWPTLPELVREKLDDSGGTGTVSATANGVLRAVLGEAEAEHEGRLSVYAEEVRERWELWATMAPALGCSWGRDFMVQTNIAETSASLANVGTASSAGAGSDGSRTAPGCLRGTHSGALGPNYRAALQGSGLSQLDAEGAQQAKKLLEECERSVRVKMHRFTALLRKPGM